jgi:carbon monoxide dehydrogenase subunit G
MELLGHRQLGASQSQAWQALNDPNILKQAIPGCERFERISDTEYGVTVALKIGPVAAKFNGKVFLNDIVAPHSYSLAFEAQGGMAGFGKGQSKVTLKPTTSEECELSYTVQSQVGGKIAQLGQRLIEGAAKSLADDFFTRFEKALVNELSHGEELAPSGVDASTPSNSNIHEPLYLESNPFARKALYGITFAVALLLIYFWITLK